MVKISKKAEYALRALVAIAKRPTSRPVSIQELAEGDEIPLKFLEQILLALKNGGFLASKRGVGGGYRLAKAPDQVSLAEVLELIDGPLRPLADAPRSTGLARTLAELEDLVEGFLADHTIADLVANERERDAMAFEI
jgi:Rrf2 family protein